MKALLRSACRALRCALRPRVLVLTYHHVCPHGRTAPYLTVVPERFEEHVAFLARHRMAVSIDQLLDYLRDGRFPRTPKVLVTIDDAAEDVFDYAAPILQRYRVPATVFVPTGLIGSGTEFWWNRLYVLGVYADTRGIDLYEWLSGQNPMLAGPDPRNTLWRRLRLLPAAEIEDLLAACRAYLGHPVPEPTPYPMTRDQLKGIADGLITLGAHTVTHPMLAAIPDDQLEWELATGRADLAQLGAYRDVFAYPYGDPAVVTPRTRRAVQAAGYQCSFTTHPASVTSRTDHWALGRIGAEDCASDAFRWAIDRGFSQTEPVPGANP